MADASTPTPPAPHGPGASGIGRAIIRPIEIRVDQLSRAFGDHVVLDRISFDIYHGDIVAIVGGSGSGKTVLLDHMTGLHRPQSGRVLAADHDVEPSAAAPRAFPLVDLATLSEDDLDRIRLHWAIVFQHNALFGGSVFDNIALWFREHTSLDEHEIARRVRESLVAVQMSPDDVGPKERAELSGGMAKRVAIARALATDPFVIFYDEPTTGLDPVVGAHIHELIWNTHNRRPVRDFARDASAFSENPPLRRTSIIVTHDRELLRRLRPRVVMLADTRIVFDGSYDEFSNTENPQAQLYLRAMPVLHARPTDAPPDANEKPGRRRTARRSDQ
jgi:phospholipid/cholesterol/gamma-HCH transport system ATP-binding protein